MRIVVRKPFDVEITRDASRGKAAIYRPFELPDSLYRQTARRLVAKLVEENRALRRDRHRPPSVFAVALVWALERVLQKTPYRRFGS